jgi:hypothetical protein
MRHRQRGHARRRRCLPVIVVVLVLIAGCRPGGGVGGGTGGGGNNPNALYETDAGLPNHTVFRPRDLAAVTRPMPVVVWGNGACSAESSFFGSMNLPLAATGVLVLANGTPGGSGSTTWQQLIESVDFAIRENGRQGSKYFGKLDTDAISAQGQSCGGVQALQAAADPRIKSVIAWNSGFLWGRETGMPKLHQPVAWLNGGPSDLAYPVANTDFAEMPAGIPAVLGSYGDVGHMGLFTNATLAQHAAAVNRSWLDATLYGEPQAKAQFVGRDCALCTGTQWTLQSKNW